MKFGTVTFGTATFGIIMLGTASCISFDYQRDIIECEPLASVVSELAAGEASLDDVLAQLGAPIDVWEGANGGAVLSYGGLRCAEWNVDVSVPVSDYGSASLSYTDTTAKTRGTIFVFDEALQLQIVRSGLLADLRQAFTRRRPASIEGDEEIRQP